MKITGNILPTSGQSAGITCIVTRMLSCNRKYTPKRPILANVRCGTYSCMASAHDFFFSFNINYTFFSFLAHSIYRRDNEAAQSSSPLRCMLPPDLRDWQVVVKNRFTGDKTTGLFPMTVQFDAQPAMAMGK